MNHLLTNPIAIDVDLQKLQIDLYAQLESRWANKSIDGYGRVYRNNETPEYFSEQEGYVDTFLNDKIDASFSFIVSEESPTEDQYMFNNDVKVVFIVNLKSLFPAEQGRADQMAQRDAVELLRKISRQRYLITGVQTGLANVFSGFDISKITKDDLHPFHIFSVNTTLNFQVKDKC